METRMLGSTWYFIAPIIGILVLLLALFIAQSIIAQPSGNERMREVAEAIREGASAYLREQFRQVMPIIVVVGIVIGVLPMIMPKAVADFGWLTSISFMGGALSSLLAGFLGMQIATKANVRTSEAARQNKPTDALLIAFNGGAVMGLTVAGLGLIGLGSLFYFFGTPTGSAPIVGFGLGASSVALFARIGGGIYTKAADVGSDLVGKMEAGIPEDDPRNPGVIADNVGDNVGDVAGMGADIFESFVSITIGCIAVAVGLDSKLVMQFVTNTTLSEDLARVGLMFFPIAQGIAGALACVIAIFSMRVLKKLPADKALWAATLLATGLYLAFAAGLFLLFPIRFALWPALLVGALCGLGIGWVSEVFTAGKPVFRIAEASKTGPATNIISGIGVGFLSSAFPVLLIVLATGVANAIGGIYASALAGVAMLATVAITMTIDAYGPIADNAGGISQLSHLGEETRAITDKLDAIGNTTAAIGKGFAIGASGLTALSLFAAYVQLVRKADPQANFSLDNPNLAMGVFLGAILPVVVAALTMESVGKAAQLMVTEIRRQFREIPGLLEGKVGVHPDVQKCVAISTQAAIREMRLPGLLAIASPIVVGIILKKEGLGGFLLGTTVVGVILGIFMANAGGAWDNAKKYIEQGRIEGEAKGGAAHSAAVVGDTVGDPFKDTSGPALNILIKMVSILALLLAPLLN
jgi:K(+)-stimulated pyrophosphate-energized sodium pump